MNPKFTDSTNPAASDATPVVAATPVDAGEATRDPADAVREAAAQKIQALQCGRATRQRIAEQRSALESLS